MSDTGFLILADISGFTAFVTATELEHGPAVTADLLDSVARALAPVAEIEGLQGDCVFAIAPGRQAGSTTTLDGIEASFVAFKRRQREMQLGTTCTCSACRAIPTLGLKFIVHCGSFVRQTIGGRTQVASGDVILAHRLLKNSVRADAGYVLLSAAAFERIGTSAASAGLTPHTEEYEHLGAVRCFVQDLAPVWERAGAAQVRMEEKDAAFSVSGWVPVAPAVAWDWLNEPERRNLYDRTAKRWSEDVGRSGRRGVGTVYHCHHGKDAVQDFKVVDWRPFDYWTIDVPLPMGAVARGTTELRAENGGTRIVMHMGASPESTWYQKLLLTAVAPVVRKQRTAALVELRAVLERGNGETTTSSPPAPPP